MDQKKFEEQMRKLSDSLPEEELLGEIMGESPDYADQGGVLDYKTGQIIFDKVEDDRLMGEITMTLKLLEAVLRPGSRNHKQYLEQYMETPLNDIEQINERLGTIEELVENRELRKTVEWVVKAFAEETNGYLAALRRFIQSEDFQDVGYIFSGAHAGLRDSIKSLAEIGANLPDKLAEGEYATPTLQRLCDGYREILMHRSPYSLFEFLKYIVAVNDKITGVESERKRKKFYGDVKEIFAERGVELPQNLSPEEIVEYLEKQSEKLKESSELKNAIDHVRHQAHSKLYELSHEKWITHEELAEMANLEHLEKFSGSLVVDAPIFNELYTYSELAKDAIKEKLTRPYVVPKEENCLVIRRGYWPYTTRNKDNVANNTILEDGAVVEVLEGVNDGGKTIDMKKALYIAARALAGCFVPAEYARVSVRDKIILREKGKGDSISAFQQDARSAREVYPPEGEYWLIGMDETFTSTEKKGGRSLTYGLVKAIHEQGKSSMIISSHYLGLSKSFEGDNSVAFSHMPFVRSRNPKPTEDRVYFLYKKRPGPQRDFRYAIEVAGTHNFDGQVLDFASQRLRQRYGK